MTLASQSETARHALPLLHVGQSQKEIFHNEALTRIDHIIMPVIETASDNPDVLVPEPGQSWLVLAPAQGEWTGHAGKIASWTENGWRYWEPKAGTHVFDRQADCFRIFHGDGWFAPTALPAPTGGTTIDVEARAAISSILGILRDFRFFP